MDIPYGAALFVVWAGYASFTLYSGSRGVVITDTMMFLLFGIVSFVGLALLIGATGQLLRQAYQRQKMLHRHLEQTDPTQARDRRIRALQNWFRQPPQQ